jgi:hypothetical protein
MRTTLGLSTPACDRRSTTTTVVPSCAALAVVLGALAATAPDARADDSSALAAVSPVSPAPTLPAAASDSALAPPPSQHSYVQFGVGLAAEVVESPGPICSNVSNCILGSGGGLVVRVGFRPVDRWYVGGAYEVSKQDPSQLYRLGILQQLRAEGRRYFPTGRETSPFVVVGAGASGYGDEWRVDTWGINATLGGGLEIELGAAVLAISMAYRPMYFESWSDTSGIPHDAGVAHFLSLEVSIEAQDRL